MLKLPMAVTLNLETCSPGGVAGEADLFRRT
jgi:hypothetical protein